MSLPRIAIVGRPNVGKSSLFNRLAKRRVSIVDAVPGVTRDRVSLVLEVQPPLKTPRGTPGRKIELVDTGGYGVYTADGRRYNEIGEDLARLTPDIEDQIRAARTRADLVLFVVDAQAGLTALDQTVATMLREENMAHRVIVVANKVDGEVWIPHGLEAAGIGLGEPSLVSASTSYGVRDLFDRLWAEIRDLEKAGAFIDRPDENEDDGRDPALKLAIVGRRNAGKSTLINSLAGEPRMIVSEIAGTTRDAVDVRFERDGRALLAIDTAGMRKKKSFAEDVEFYAYRRMLDAVKRADVVALLLDATREVSQVDRRLSRDIIKLEKPVVIVVNKIDLLDKNSISPEDYLEYITQQLRGLDYAPIVFISAESADGMDELVAMAFNLHQQASHREPTSSLNRVIERILALRGPSSRLGTQAKLYYASQLRTNPPTIALVVNKPDLFDARYERYLMNRLREELPYSEVPIRLIFSARGRKSLEDLKAGGRARAKEAAAAEAGLEGAEDVDVTADAESTNAESTNAETAQAESTGRDPKD